jgi:uncharacterized membrane protein
MDSYTGRRLSIIFAYLNSYPVLGLTPLGIFHTAVSLVAVAAGVLALVRDGKITWHNGIGKLYVTATVIVCLTGFGIYQHGGFGKPHALGILTLLVLLIAAIGGKLTRPFGRLSPYVERIGYSLTFFFHIIPGVTETTSRFPQGHPLTSGPDDPVLKPVFGVCFLLFLIGAVWQGVSLRKKTTRA